MSGIRRRALLAGLLLLAGRPASAGLERVSPEVFEAFRRPTTTRVSLLVRWSGTPEWPAAREGVSRRERRRRLVAALRECAGYGAGVCARLSLRDTGLKPRPLWIVNGTAVSADRQALLQLAHEPGVRAVLAPPPLRLFQAAPLPPPGLTASLLSLQATAAEPPLPWHVQRVHAPEVWAQGITGQGVVVATIDTGVDPNHPALSYRYRGLWSAADERNWFDAVQGRSSPYDDAGHGTQTMGAILGNGGPGNRVGTAPLARWIAVKAADAAGVLDLVNVLRAMQWLLAPTDRAGEHPHPDLAPDVVSNSWGDYPGTDETLRDAVRAWVAAGIVPVFAAGNNGLGSMGSPASYPEAIAVGATDGRDEVAPFSSRGPSPIDEGMKPDVAAPGVLVRTSTLNGAYFPYTGTSFAAPVAAGIAALLLQANPGLTPPVIADVLRSTADPTPGGPIPNLDVGWGRVNALAAVTAVRPPSPNF